MTNNWLSFETDSTAEEVTEFHFRFVFLVLELTRLMCCNLTFGYFGLIERETVTACIAVSYRNLGLLHTYELTYATDEWVHYYSLSTHSKLTQRSELRCCVALVFKKLGLCHLQHESLTVTILFSHFGSLFDGFRQRAV